MMKKIVVIVLTMLGMSLDIWAGDSDGENGGVRTVRHLLTPEWYGGLGLTVDANGLHGGRYSERQVPDKPAISFSLTAMAQLGTVNDVLNLSLGLGDRGLFDQAPPHEFIYNASFSDYLLYTKSDHREGGSEVRPLGGLLVVPLELHVNLFPFNGGAVFIGSGVEYALRLYQSKRYGEYFGSHILNKYSLSVNPMIGITGDTDEFVFSLSLYFRHYLQNCFNVRDIPVGKFARNHLGLQFSIVF